MASRAYFIDFEAEPTGVQKSPQKTIRIVHRSYKLRTSILAQTH